MALPLAAAAAGASLIGTGVNAWQTGRMNRKSRQFSREMYERQKQDQLLFWRMQNEYNAPSAEMARLKAAGLNPALMYGSGAQANRAGDIGSPKAMSARFDTPSVDVGNSILAYNQTRVADKQMELLEAEKAQKYAAAFKDLWSGEDTKFGVGLKNDTRALMIEKIMAETTTAEARASMDKMANQVQFELFKSGKSLESALSDVVYKQLRNDNLKVQRSQLQQAISNLKKDGVLKDMEIQLRKASGQTYSTGTIIGPILRYLYSLFSNNKGWFDPHVELK